jgi:hypothetical protein
MATYTATLNLSDSGNTFSSSTSSPLKINGETYTKAFSKIADIASGASITHTIPFDAEFIMIRATSGTIFTLPYDSNIALNGGTTPTLTAFLEANGFKLSAVAGDMGAKGWFMYSCTVSPTGGRAIDSIYIQEGAAAAATYEIIAYA